MHLKFLSYYPLKQGLKQAAKKRLETYSIEFLSYYPLKQGLKLDDGTENEAKEYYFYPTIH